ncbi:MAG: hypothetical protein C4583_08620 [Anaerolineaceae bacterium]|nr:MAG: hypothetical protein C4583_08620 [Anaerolineaceae bacterium]
MKHIRINSIFILLFLLAGTILLTGCEQETGWGITGDNDKDGIISMDDNCPDVANPDQADADDDGIGDACDPEPNIPDEAQQVPEPPADGCPQVDLFATFLPNGQIGIWDAQTTIPDKSFDNQSQLTYAGGNPMTGTFTRESGDVPLLFTPYDSEEASLFFFLAFEAGYSEEEAKDLYDHYLYIQRTGSLDCLFDVRPLPNPANLPPYTQDATGDVQQHMNPGQPATNAAPYDDILWVMPWLDSYPLHSWREGLSRKVIFAPHPPKLAKLAQAESNDAPVLIQTLSSTTFTYTLPGGTSYPGLDGMPLPPGQIDFGNSAFSIAIEDVNKAGNPVISLLEGTGPDGFQVFHPGAWTAEPLQINGKNFSVSLAGAWSGVVSNFKNSETAIWVARGEAEVSGNGKTVKLSGPNDGATVALSVIASDGTPAAAETVTPIQLGERFGVYTGAMPGRLTFEVRLAGPFQPWPLTEEMLTGMGWQVVLDMDGNPATGATGDILAAQGLGFEVFCTYYEKEACSFRNASGEKISFPKELFTVTFDPQGRVVMSASWADLQAIAKEAGVTLDPAKMSWRFSHINSMLDGTPQDVFPEP